MFMLKLLSLLLVFSSAIASAQEVTVTVGDKAYSCGGEAYKYYCHCIPPKPNYSGAIWYRKLNLQTGQTTDLTLIEYFSSDVDCATAMFRQPLCH
jgi:hypothetical protein